MQLRLIKKSTIIIILLSIKCFILPETFSYRNFYITFNNPLSKNQLQKIIDLLKESEDFFIDKFKYVPKEKLDFYIFDSVNQMMNALDVASWIGAYYNANNVYLQPIDVLVKKNMLEKIIFTEYAHYYINDISNNNCPLWLNEALSSYYSRFFLNDKINNDKDIKLINKFSDLVNIKNIFKDYNFSRNFYYSFELFINYLNNKYDIKVFDLVLSGLKDGKVFNDAFFEVAGSQIDYLYENEFLRQVNVK